MVQTKKKITRSTKIKPEEPPYEVSYLQLYKYGKWYELFVTLAGIILGLLSGGGVPFVMAMFGEMTTAFLERTTHVQQTSYLPMLASFGGGRQITNGTHEELMAALLEDASALVKGMFASAFLCIVFIFLGMLMINWVALKQITRIRKLYLRSVLRQDMSWYDTETSFNMASRISDDMMKLKDGIGDKVGIVANLVGTAVIAICTAFPLGWELTLACLSVLPFSIASSVALTKYQIHSSVKGLESYSKAGKLAEEVLKSVRTVVSFGGEKKEVARYARLLAPSEQYDRKRGLYTGIATGFNWVLTYSLNSIGLAYGTRLVINDMAKPTEERDYQVGEILTILFNIYMATQCITFCVPHSESFSNARAAAVSIFQLIEREPKIDATNEEGLAPRRVYGDINFEDVHFAYPSRPEVKVLKGLSLHIKAGESVALVGPSGCGKSTVLQLIQRLYDPSHGNIQLDGKEITKLNLSWLRSSLGVVGQEPVLFGGTIIENIAIGMPEATFEEVQKVSEMAYAHEFIKNLPQGYDTVIGERGASLSGGQKQRIAIARSLLREPVILLLDEATSALDSHSEKQVQAALDRAAAGRTTLTVSHRISTIQNANRIVCMDQGKIVEEGTYDYLMSSKGFFWNLVQTGKDVKKVDTIEASQDDEKNDGSNKSVDVHPVLEVADVKKTRKIHRRPSNRREKVDWMSPRPSLASVMSSGIQNYLKSFDSENEIDKDQDGEVLNSLSNWEILKLNAPEWPTMVLGFFAAFIQGACFPVFAVLFGYAMGMFTLLDHNEILQQSTLYSVLFLVVGTIAGVSMCIQGTTFTSSGLKMTTRLRLQYFSSLLHQEIGYFDKPSNSVGALCSRLSSDTAEVQGATGLCVGLILQGVSSVAIGFLMGVSFNWKLTLVAVALLPLLVQLLNTSMSVIQEMVGSIWLEGIVSQKSQNDERKAMEAATSIATEAVISIKTVQSLGIENVFRDKFDETLLTAIDSVSRKSRWRGLVYGLGIYIPMISYCSATAYGTTLVANEGLEYKVVLLVNEAIMYGAYMLGQSLVYAPNIKSAKYCAARILATINRVPNVKSEEGVVDLQSWKATGEVDLKDLDFSYPTRPFQKIIQGIDLKVESGKTLALVGPSGCGKSTILQLMQRFYDPLNGNIELDGRDIRFGLTLPRLRQQLGVVQQEPVLFERSLADNIAYGDNSRKVSMQEVVEAARAANIHSFIVSLPKGYETRVGGGTQLSGGQKQRVCIARALVRAPRLLLLDEATSALDAGSERQVSEALQMAAKGRTCVTIAHRLSTVREADVICVMDKGRIVESGSHEELIALQGHYWRMSRGQAQDTLEV